MSLWLIIIWEESSQLFFVCVLTSKKGLLLPARQVGIPQGGSQPSGSFSLVPWYGLFGWQSPSRLKVMQGRCAPHKETWASLFGGVGMNWQLETIAARAQFAPLGTFISLLPFSVFYVQYLFPYSNSFILNLTFVYQQHKYFIFSFKPEK